MKPRINCRSLVKQLDYSTGGAMNYAIGSIDPHDTNEGSDSIYETLHDGIHPG